MYTLILIEVQFTRLVSIRSFVTLVVIFTTNMVGSPSLSQPDLDTFMYYVKNKFSTAFQLSSYQNWKSKQNNNQKSHYICFN